MAGWLYAQTSASRGLQAAEWLKALRSLHKAHDHLQGLFKQINIFLLLYCGDSTSYLSSHIPTVFSEKDNEGEYQQNTPVEIWSLK